MIAVDAKKVIEIMLKPDGGCPFFASKLIKEFGQEFDYGRMGQKMFEEKFKSQPFDFGKGVWKDGRKHKGTSP